MKNDSGGEGSEDFILHPSTFIISNVVAHLVAFGFEILRVVLVGLELDGHLLDDLEFVPLQTDDLARVVGHEADLTDAEIKEDLCAEAVVAQVHREAELEVRLHRVVALLLELVSVDLGGQSDAATFLTHVKQHAATFLLDASQRGVKLTTAIAAA